MSPLQFLISATFNSLLFLFCFTLDLGAGGNISCLGGNFLIGGDVLIEIDVVNVDDVDSDIVYDVDEVCVVVVDVVVVDVDVVDDVTCIVSLLF